jgi:hypothetical protein
VIVMQAAPDLTKTERDEAIARCPEQQRGLFTDWLDGKRDLAGDLIEGPTR